MIVDDAFVVAAPLERVWPVLKDVPRVAGCIPGAQITETVDDRTYKASVNLKVGPVSVTYRVTIVLAKVDDEAHAATIDVKGDDTKGRGGVRATVVTSAQQTGAETRVSLHTDAQISGIIATLGGRIVESVAKKTVAQFAANLSAIV